MVKVSGVNASASREGPPGSGCRKTALNNGEKWRVAPIPRLRRKNCDKGESRALEEVAASLPEGPPEVLKHRRLPAGIVRIVADTTEEEKCFQLG